MYIQVKSSNGITLVPIETRLLDKRRIFIEGEIDSNTAGEFVRSVMYLNMESEEEPINVLINSPGGQINSGMLMYDVIQSSKAPVRMYCTGVAYSMAAVLLACGNNGRYILPHSEVMIHEPLITSGVGGKASSIKSISDTLIETQEKMNRILAKHTGKTEEEIAKATSYDHYLSPRECVDFGICDKITDFSEVL